MLTELQQCLSLPLKALSHDVVIVLSGYILVKVAVGASSETERPVHVERRLFGEMRGACPFKYISDHFSAADIGEAAQTGRQSTSDRKQCVFNHSGDSICPSGSGFNAV